MKRFYDAVSISERDGGFQVELDARPIKTATGKAQIVPARALAGAMAEEWQAQAETLDRALFRFRDLADFAIDLVAADRKLYVDKLLAFLETDTLCYRADPDEPFYARQTAEWEPVLTAFENREGVRLERVSGIMHRPQPETALAAIRATLDRLDPFALTALLTLSSLSASLVIGLSAIRKNAQPERLWQAANLEEDWQIEQWGEDADAKAVRTQRTDDFLNAFEFYRLLRR